MAFSCRNMSASRFGGAKLVNITGAGEMAGAQLKDRRRNAAAARLLDRLFTQHCGSFSSTVGEAGRQAAHRLFESEEIAPNALLSGHVQATCARMRLEPGKRVLILQDTTDFDYSNHRKTAGLGSIGQSPRWGRGLQSHGALAASESGIPLGVVDLYVWSRPIPEKAMPKAQRHKIKKSKPTCEKESQKWLDCLGRVEKQIQVPNPLLFVQDREADMFELFLQPRRVETDLLVRAAQPRLVEIATEEGEAAEVLKLFDAAKAAPLLGQTTVEVPACQTRKARTALLEVRARRILLRPPASTPKELGWMPQPLWLIWATETNAPEGVAALSWTLLSTIAAETFEAACTMIGYYAKRWLIERLHFALKSGLNAEGVRFDDAHSLQNALSLYYIVAWRLLYLTYLARAKPLEPASSSFMSVELEVLGLLWGQQVETIREAVSAIARLGGYRPSNKGGPPGVKTLWLGLRKLEAMVKGFMLARAVT